MGFTRIRWDSLGFVRTRQDSVGFDGTRWDSLRFARNLCDSLEFARIRWDWYPSNADLQAATQVQLSAAHAQLSRSSNAAHELQSELHLSCNDPLSCMLQLSVAQAQLMSCS